MLTLRHCVLLIAVLALILVFGACTREITHTETVQAPMTCFNCHSDVDTWLIAAEQQWANSKHASGENTNRSYSPCSGCHTSEGFKDRIAGTGAGTYANPTVIHCFTCHAPHSNGDFSLRVTAAQTLTNGVSVDIKAANLCVACHQARRSVDTYVAAQDTVTLSSHWGPHHSVQADMLFGTNGYEYAGYTYEDLDWHRNLTQDGCLDCHFRVTRNFVVGGHSFNMRAVIADEPEVGEHQEFTEVLNTGACAACHGTLPNFNRKGIQDSVMTLADSLKSILITAAVIDSSGHPIDKVKISPDSAGALWNFLMIEEDRSWGVHNSKYMLGLLESAIMFMEGSLQPQPLGAPPAAPVAARKPETPASSR